MLTNLKNSNGDKTKTNSRCDKTKKSNCEKNEKKNLNCKKKNSNRDKTQIVKTQIVIKLKCDKTQIVTKPKN